MGNGGRPPLKRRRIDDDDEDVRSESDHFTRQLPPEIWALALDFLPYDSLLQTAAVARSMLRDVLPRVSELHIDRAEQLHAGIAASRYRDIRDVYIYSLIEYYEDGSNQCFVDEDTATRAIPFLCGGQFRKLERVFLGGRMPGDGFVTGFIPADATDDEDQEKMKALITSFSAAFRAGALAESVWVSGLRCPLSSRFRNMFRDSSCLVCKNACRSFPLQAVIDFESEGSSQRRVERRHVERRHDLPDTYDEQIYGLDVCLKREKIEAIIKQRAGGKELLYSEERFIQLLGRGTRHIVVPDEGKQLYVVKYDDNELGEMKLLLQNAAFNAKDLSPCVVKEAIKRSFAADERDPLPPREQCYLAEKTFSDLQEMGLPIDEADYLNADEFEGKRCGAAHLYNWRFA